MNGLGSKLRNARAAAGLTIAEVAQRSELSVSYVSEVERDRANPSVGALNRIAGAVGIRMSSLFSGDSDAPPVPSPPGESVLPLEPASERITPRVVKRDRRKQFIYPGSGVVNELLCPDLQPALEIQQVEAPVGADSGHETITHPGEECVIVLSGAMEIEVGQQTVVLEEGDALYFAGADPHTWRNIGAEVLKVIFVITPPHF